MKFTSKRATAIVALALSAAVSLTACGSNSDDSGSKSSSGGGKTTVTFLPKNLGNPYFDTSDKGGEAAVKEFGGTYAQVGPQEATPDGQVPFINTAAQQGIKAIVISADDASAPCDALKQAMSA